MNSFYELTDDFMSSFKFAKILMSKRNRLEYMRYITPSEGPIPEYILDVDILLEIKELLFYYEIN